MPEEKKTQQESHATLPDKKKRMPINLRKKSRILVIQPSTEVTKILVTSDRDKTRIWVDVPGDASFEIPESDVDKSV